MRLLLFTLVFILFNQKAISQVNLSSGLVAYFPFNGNSLDASGNGNNAANFGATLTTDQWGNPNSAYSFNGASNYMQILNNSGLQPTQLTLSVRVKPMGFYNGNCYNNCIIDKGDIDYIPGNYGIRFTNALTGNCLTPGFANQNYRSDIGDVSASSFAIPFGGTPYVATNQWDCIISTYDGITVKVFVNGVLRYSYTQNNIGSNNNNIFLGRKNSATFPYWFNGIMDEVRIYDRVLNTLEIDSLCNFVTPPPPIEINKYASVNSYNPCNNSLEVDTSSFFAIGDTVLLIQMKGAEIDSTNSSSFGNIINLNNSGNYEINVVQNVIGSTVYLLNNLTYNYDIPNGKVQLVTVPTKTNYSVDVPHSCMPWNGSKGGVFIINVLDTLTLKDEINVTGKGFRGGISNIINSSVSSCNNFQFFDAPNIDFSAAKGEGITSISLSKSFAKGKLANGGGGGNGHNGGGGGGSNAGMGGIGGSQFKSCNPSPIPNNTGGLGGLDVNYISSSNRVFLGGGGGAGHSNNYYSTYPSSNNFTSNGASGGGLVIIKANIVNSISGSIKANGDNGFVCVNTGAYGICHDGMGGGGAGGSVLISSGLISGLLPITCVGGNGGNMSASSGSGLGQLGPGGGGGGGLIWHNGTAIPSPLVANTAGGLNGVCLNYSNDAWGAQSGQSGEVLNLLQIPLDSILFIPSNQVDAGSNQTICQGSSAQLQANGAGTFSWIPSSTLNDTTISNPIASPIITTTYTVILTDSNGCSTNDIVTINVIPSPVISALAIPTSLCPGDSTILTSSGASSYSWSGGVSGGVPFAPTATTTYTVIGTDINGCTNSSTILVIVNPLPNVVANSSIGSGNVCAGGSIILFGSGANTYTWTGGVINNAAFFPTTPSTYTVTGVDANGCSNTSSISISILPIPTIGISATDTTLCLGESTILSGTGGVSYVWSGGAINGVSFIPSTTSTYTVIGTDANGCTSTSQVAVSVISLPSILASAVPSSVCEGNETTLTASGAGNYTWSGGVLNGISFTPISTTTYTVTGSDANGCSNTSSVTVNVLGNLTINITPNNPILCIGDSIQLVASGATNYSWDPNTAINSANISNPIVYPTSTTVYTVTGSDANGCTGTSDIIISLIPKPELIVTKSGDIECNNNTIQLSVSGASSYAWEPATFLSSSNSSTTNATVFVPTVFTVTGMIGTCEVKDSIKIEMFNDDENSIFIPTAFSPNQDGINDCFKIIHQANFQSYYLSIYNRWGERVFESDNTEICWDGNFKSQPAEQGVYYFYLKAETKCGKIFKKGDITLIR